MLRTATRPQWRQALQGEWPRPRPRSRPRPHARAHLHPLSHPHPHSHHLALVQALALPSPNPSPNVNPNPNSRLKAAIVNYGYDLAAWRESVEGTKGYEQGVEILDKNGGADAFLTPTQKPP